MYREVKDHLQNTIIPFWRKLRDDEFGGYYGYMDYDLKVDTKAVKGCILNSRILWFFINAYETLGDKGLLGEAEHAYAFLRDHCMDQEKGGIYWSLSYDGKPYDETKHTYNQAFAIYALSSYYGVTKDEEAKKLAYSLYHVIEDRCRDNDGYLEAFDREFKPSSNEKLSENGVIAYRTMNTLLHVLEAYTELYRVTGDHNIAEKLRWIVNLWADKIYNKELHRQEVFFDASYHSLIDLHSYGHDIETSWLLDRTLEVLDDDALTSRVRPMTLELAEEILKKAFVDGSLMNECENGVDDTNRIWWVQAETVLGFLNAYQKNPEKEEFLSAAKAEWEYIKTKLVDHRDGSEWYWKLDANGNPVAGDPIVEPWKCPYHNGRMCFEVMKRLG